MHPFVPVGIAVQKKQKRVSRANSIQTTAGSDVIISPNDGSSTSNNADQTDSDRLAAHVDSVATRVDPKYAAAKRDVLDSNKAAVKSRFLGALRNCDFKNASKLCLNSPSRASVSGSDASGSRRSQPQSPVGSSIYEGPMEPTFKCLVIGDVGVGKTSFVQKYVYNKKIKDYKSTLGGMSSCWSQYVLTSHS